MSSWPASGPSGGAPPEGPPRLEHGDLSLDPARRVAVRAELGDPPVIQTVRESGLAIEVTFPPPPAPAHQPDAERPAAGRRAGWGGDHGHGGT